MWRNIDVTITRRGAGLGGIFVSEEWCNKEYIEKTFGQMEIDKRTIDNGMERWTFGGGTDGWVFHVFLEFNPKGQVSEFQFHCTDVRLW
jgi:hypothetical protein